MAIYDENAIITTATTYFNNAKRYIRKKDMQIYHRTKSLSKSDMDFLEQFMLIHIKNIEKGSKIPQNFYAFLDNFILDNLFVKHFFSSFEMLRLICYRFSILPSHALLKDTKKGCDKILTSNIKKYKPHKKAKNLLYVFTPLPNLQSDIESFINTCLDLFTQDKINGLIINPLNLILNIDFKDQTQRITELSSNLQTLLNNSNAKMLILDNDCENLFVLLASIENAVKNISYPVDITLSLPSYHFMSLEALDYIAELSKKLCAQNKAKLCVRLKDLDYTYDIMEFKAAHTRSINTHFTNKANARSNLIALITKCFQYKEILTCHITSTNMFIIALAKSLDMQIRFEIEANLHYPLYRILAKQETQLFSTSYFTTQFSDMIALRLKGVHTSLNYGLLDYISMLYNKQEWEKKSKAFLQSLAQSKKDEIKKEYSLNALKDSTLLTQTRQYNFETFDYTLRKPLVLSQMMLLANLSNKDSNTESSKDSIDTNKQISFLKDLENLQISMPNTNKLEDILYLNAQDMHRLNMQSMNNAPATFSLYAEKEKEELAKAQKMQEEILQNRSNIITSIIGRLKECIPALFATLCELYPNTPQSIYEEQVYMLLDSFKYYAYAYKQLLQETESVLLMPLGNIFIHTKKLAIHEIGAVIASNIMIGNVSFLEDSIIARIFYYLFTPIFDFCPFLCVMESKRVREKEFIDYEIITKQDFMKLQASEKTSNFLVWDKGVSVIFISSFYDIHEAAKEVQYMRFSLHAQILIYTDSYIYEVAKQIFIPSQVTQTSLADLIANLPEDTSNFSLFTYNKAEMNYAINKLKVSICINGAYKSKLVSGTPRTFSPGYLQPFGSKLLLGKLVQTSPNSVILHNSLYSDIIGCFSEILSADEIEFLYNLNHNYSQFLKNIARTASLDNIYETKKPYSMCVRVYEKDDFFHVCVIMLISFLLQIQTRLSFTKEYFTQDSNTNITKDTPKKLQKALQENYIDYFTLIFEDEKDFRDSINADTLVRILQDESEFATTETYAYLSKKGIIAEYSLPILNRHLELERYLATQYIQIEPNILLQTHVR